VIYKMMKKPTSNFNRFASVLSEGFTAEDATPPAMPMNELVKAMYPKTIRMNSPPYILF